MKKITDGLYAFTGLIAGRVYLIEDGQAGDLTIIDAGITSAASKIVRQIEAHGRSASDVKRILITHAHPDHVGGLPELQRLTGAEVYSSEVEQPVIEGAMAVPRPAREELNGLGRMMWRAGELLPGTPVSHTVSDSEVLQNTMGGLQVIATPGHAPGHISFWQAERCILIGGDVVFNVLGLRLPPAAFTPDMDANKRSLARIAKLDAQIACFGHGPALTKDTAARLRAFAHKVNSLPYSD